MENLDIVKDVFETTYNDYKSYEAQVNSETKSLENDRSNFAKFVLENKDDLDLVLDKMFDVNEKPALQKKDLLILQNKLINAYEVVKDVIDIPKEVREEINALPRQRMSYKLDNGKFVEINKDMNKEIRKFVKDNNMSFIKNIISSQTKRN